MTDVGKALARQARGVVRDRSAEDPVREAGCRRHVQMAARHGWRQRDRSGVHSGADPRHAVRVFAGRLRSRPASSARPARRASTATCRRPKSSARCASRRNISATCRTSSAAHQRRDDGHGRAIAEFRQRRARDERDARRPRLRPGQQARHAVDRRPRADDRQVVGDASMYRLPCRCMRRTTSCAPNWCRSTRNTRSPNCSAPASASRSRAAHLDHVRVHHAERCQRPARARAPADQADAPLPTARST